MLDTMTAQTRVAVLASQEQHQSRLCHLLENEGLAVIGGEVGNSEFVKNLQIDSVDVLLVDLSEEVDSQIELIELLLEHDSLPIFFNDSSPKGGAADALWAKKLARKLSAMAKQSATAAKPAEILEETLEKTMTEPVEVEMPEMLEEAAGAEVEVMEPNIAQARVQEQAVRGEVSQLPEAAAENVWILGASLGGPQAVRQFLSAIDADLPVCFVLAQHIGANHIDLLAEQLDRITPFRVITGKSGHKLRHHEVVLAPADHLMSVTDDGYLAFKPAPEDMVYSPSIDNVMSAVSECYGKKSGTIVFSGMGDDGAKGCVDVAKHGGIVWAQDVQSCVISSMPDQARKTKTVTFSANPQALAKQLYQYYQS
jgi:chemosensory pili system protein ChpB (putative protein-glutamate methylesterase)